MSRAYGFPPLGMSLTLRPAWSSWSQDGTSQTQPHYQPSLHYYLRYCCQPHLQSQAKQPLALVSSTLRNRCSLLFFSSIHSIYTCGKLCDGLFKANGANSCYLVSFFFWRERPVCTSMVMIRSV